MANALRIKRVAAVAFCVCFLFPLSQCFRSESTSGKEPPLDVLVLRDGSIEVDGHRYQRAKDFEAFLRERKPSTVHLRPAQDATYENVSGALKAIQDVGGINIGLVGNERF
jgi:biopolymer transport protein ExbD